MNSVYFIHQEKPKEVYYNSKKHIPSGETPRESERKLLK